MMYGRSLLIFLTATTLMVERSPVWAKIVIEEIPPQENAYYVHSSTRSLEFVSPEARGQTILPSAPYFLAPPALIWRAPGSWLYSPVVTPGFNRPAAPSQRDLAAYHIARAHAMSQGLYKCKGETALRFGTTGLAGTYDGSIWYGQTWLYPPATPGTAHPSNTDNARYLIERAHRFSLNTYCKP